MLRMREIMRTENQYLSEKMLIIEQLTITKILELREVGVIKDRCIRYFLCYQIQV